MPREDYEKFIKLFKEKNEDEALRLVAPFDSDSKYTYVKVIDTRTVKIEDRIKYNNDYLGIDVDVFPMDGQPSDIKKFNKWYDKKYRLYRFHNLSVVDPKALSKVKRVLGVFINLFGRNKRYLKKAEKLNEKYPFNESLFVGSTAGLSNSKRNRYHRECYKTAIDMPFEQYTFKVPVGYDEILTAMYGDYMKPPKSTQSTHVNECYLKEGADLNV